MNKYMHLYILMSNYLISSMSHSGGYPKKNRCCQQIFTPPTHLKGN